MAEIEQAVLGDQEELSWEHGFVNWNTASQDMINGQKRKI